MTSFLRYVLENTLFLPVFKRSWDDIIFRGRNKAYGAYDLRRSSAKNQLIGLGITLSFFVGFFLFLFKGYDENKTVDFQFEKMIEFKGFDANLETVSPAKKEKLPPPPPEEKPKEEPVEEKKKEDLPPEAKEEVNDKKEAKEAKTDSLAKKDTKTSPTDSSKKYEAGLDSGATLTKYAEGQASYYGGLAEFNKWVAQNIRCPREVIESMMVKATVSVFFNIDEQGNVKDVRLLKGFNSECDNEVVRVIQSSPKWKPRVVNGVPVTQRTKVDILVDPNYYRHQNQFK